MINVNHIFQIEDNSTFQKIALQIFNYQYNNIEIYQHYVNCLGIKPESVTNINEIPFLPITFFKTNQILSKEKNAQLIFESSGTTGNQVSKHYVANENIYIQSFTKCFEHFFGSPSQYVILALLPSYLERNNSSLVYMMNHLIEHSQKDSGFYLHNFDELAFKINILKEKKQPTILFGVSFALLDFLEKYQFNFPELLVFETGGMKTKRKEIAREELHQIIKQGFNIPLVYSEYGMTELLSQAYSLNDITFQTPPWMKIFLRDMQDPLSLLTNNNQKGGINIIDLANIYSCSFIATQDIGRIHNDNSFEILGRFDNADIKGCNMLVTE